MTISLLHYNSESKLAASISATGGVSVGGYVNHSWRGLGCCATQGLFTNPWYPEKVRGALINNQSSSDIVEWLKQTDTDFELRQCLVLDKSGIASVLNGQENIPYIGSLIYKDIAIAGNMLSGPNVLQAMIGAFIYSICENPIAVLEKDMPPIYLQGYEDKLPEALINALQVGIQHGGDKRGTFSASLRVESPFAAPIDIRVDWSEHSLITDMNKILTQVRSEHFQTFLSQLPNQ